MTVAGGIVLAALAYMVTFLSMRWIRQSRVGATTRAIGSVILVLVLGLLVWFVANTDYAFMIVFLATGLLLPALHQAVLHVHNRKIRSS
ncbi:hypothetical protein [Rhodococcus marinonascens]|uniref:hypothetical protein n=1 Tax=Rhodococcus marinonascens TaxID=38311 RepID=UPI0009344C6F|nr:hypothetical protein [Rhodococcus marinonascens]